MKNRISRILKIFVPAVLLFAGTLALSAETEMLSEKPFEILDTIEDNADFRVLRVRATGRYEGKESLDYGKARARRAAEENAVAATGVNATSAETEYVSSAGTNRYTRTSIFASSGMLIDCKSVKSDYAKSPGGFLHWCEIVARVKVWKLGPDPKFAFTAVPAGEKRGRVERLEAFRHGERIDFELNSSIDAYLSVFWVGADGTAQLVVQSDAEHGKLRLRAGARTIFSKLVGVPLAVTADKDAREDGQVLFVATKTERAFPYDPGEDGRRTCSRLLTWLAEIRPDERRYESVPFTVVK